MADETPMRINIKRKDKKVTMITVIEMVAFCLMV